MCYGVNIYLHTHFETVCSGGQNHNNRQHNTEQVGNYRCFPCHGNFLKMKNEKKCSTKSCTNNQFFNPFSIKKVEIQNFVILLLKVGQHFNIHWNENARLYLISGIVPNLLNGDESLSWSRDVNIYLRKNLRPWLVT